MIQLLASTNAAFSKRRGDVRKSSAAYYYTGTGID
jgi:hypothetical protein